MSLCPACRTLPKSVCLAVCLSVKVPPQNPHHHHPHHCPSTNSLYLAAFLLSPFISECYSLLSWGKITLLFCCGGKITGLGRLDHVCCWGNQFSFSRIWSTCQSHQLDNSSVEIKMAANTRLQGGWRSAKKKKITRLPGWTRHCGYGEAIEGWCHRAICPCPPPPPQPNPAPVMSGNGSLKDISRWTRWWPWQDSFVWVVWIAFNQPVNGQRRSPGGVSQRHDGSAGVCVSES